ncbi:polysaccharide deacetylase family protein [Paenibacillus faecis]|uniref:Polysaccharide deacetylase family protein n=1 Tax=Paenibacillus faecis TaxID=862114 RepID=A0A5D0CY59_9BACL|nr:polysaccharide deacetylase family protein [Paenibacillus faecis]TYA13635.1 polysaccharide deacetylase family protein [Paenibacillus faecis]
MFRIIKLMGVACGIAAVLLHGSPAAACGAPRQAAAVETFQMAAVAEPVQEAPESVETSAKPKNLAELRRQYSETFKFRGPNVKKIALTFDDVPDPRFTPRILDILHRYDVKSTFFAVGHRVKKYPDLVQRIHREGHVLGNHSFTHPQFRSRSVKQFQQEILRTEKTLSGIIGYRPKLLRPPYGEINEGQVKWAKKNGYTIVNWNVDSLDWKGIDRTKVKANVLNAAGPGSIVLFHAGGGTGSDLTGTIEALPEIIETLRDRGYQFVTLPELLNLPKYK